MYVLVGIVDADGYIIHNVGDRHTYKNCPHTNDGRCPTIYGDRQCGIVKTCIESFKGNRALHTYRYGNKKYRSWKPIDGGQFMLYDHVNLFVIQLKQRYETVGPVALDLPDVSIFAALRRFS